MKIVRVNSEEYSKLFPNPSHVFNSVSFNELNRHKCIDIHYLTFVDDKNKVRAGIIIGENDSMFRSPFSAPFGGFEERKTQHVENIKECIKILYYYCKQYNKPVIITFPPSCYDVKGSRYTRQILAALSLGSKQLFVDYNYHYNLQNFEEFKENLWPNSRNKLSISFRNNLEFQYLDSPTELQIKKAYEIICVNHHTLGYPVHLSFEEIINTSKIIDIDFFFIKKEGKEIAAAIVYHSSKETLQLIYWGDLPNVRLYHPMNFFAYNIIGFYNNLSNEHGFKYFDLGPASSDGLPSVGLCDFKESLGCHLTPKVTLQL